MNAWAFGTLVLITLICVCGSIANNIVDRWFRVRCHDLIERQRPQLPRGPIIDVTSRPLNAQQPAAAGRRATTGL